MATTADTVEVPALEQAQARWRPSARGWALRLAVLAGIFVGLIVGIAAVPDFWADRFALAAIYAVIGLSLNVVLGYTGQVSLGHHAFVGLAAFTSAYYVTEQAGCSPDVGCTESSMGAFLVGVLLAAGSGVISAGILGLVALRIKGLYLALITLTYGFVAINSLFEVSFLTRGGAGMPAARPKGFAGDHAYAYLCLAAVALVCFIDWRFLASKAGRAVLAIKESENVAATYAVNVTAYKVMAFMMSGAFAGLAGALFAHRRGIVVAVDFTFSIALLWVLMVVVGGLGKRTGVVIGSAFFALFPFLIGLVGPLEHFITDTMNRDPEEMTLIIGPVLAIFTIVSFPGGIAEQISPITRWLGGERFTMHPEGKRKHEGPNLLHKLGIGRTKEAPQTEGAAAVSADAPSAVSADAPSAVSADAPSAVSADAPSAPEASSPFQPPATPSSAPTDEMPAASSPPEEASATDDAASVPSAEIQPKKRARARFSKLRIPARSRRADTSGSEWPDVLDPRAPTREGREE